MKNKGISYIIIPVLIIGGALFSSFLKRPVSHQQTNSFPYESEGLTKRQAAAHLLSRFTYGATPGQVDEVAKMGLENWFEQQLTGGLPDDSVKERLTGYDALAMSNADVIRAFPKPIQVLRLAKAEGIIADDSAVLNNKKMYKDVLLDFARKKNFRRQSELYRQFISQKILRAAYSNNQVQEKLTEFWFNHFNVSLTKRACALFIPSYERDVIRPNVTGKFGNLLLATAKSPAMLLYLDNFSSAGPNNTDEDSPLARRLKKAKDANLSDSATKDQLKRLQRLKKNQGLNENYAREVMELHTLGVDGGYTQDDVTQAARVLTGWTVYPMEDGYGNALRKLIDRVGEDKLIQRGYVHDGDFLFAMNRHDNGSKTVMGKKFAADGGYEEGTALLSMLAHHASTAQFISKKLAAYFVNDVPPKSLVDKMANTFLEKDGDIKEVLRTMVNTREFWSASAVREKTKSPFELAISSIRALQADIEQPYQVFNWVEKMGQKMYYYQAPTGFPDRAQYWINTGALLNRMNFGLSIASGQMRGVSTDLASLNNYHEPESATDALVTYGKLMMPERNLDETIKRLTPLLTEPGLDKKIENASKKITPQKTTEAMMPGDEDEDLLPANPNEEAKMQRRKNKELQNGKNMLAQVVGIIIGSPEFQRK